VYYDAVGRWVPLEPFGVCNHEREGTLRTPSGFAANPVPGQPFDSGTPGCVWHRLFLDAAIPEGCAIAVGARAADDGDLLERLPFRPQPTPYLRGAGAELPWYDPWGDVAVRPTSPRTGTWELLFQNVVGRYVQLELTFSGTGRTTPSVRALRAWYPRFSYVRAYLPEVYQEEDEPARFLERMLANMEGLLTEHEQRIDHAWMLVDPRTSPADAFDWLASWVGLRLEPAWSSERRRFLLRHVDRLYRIRGTIGGLRALLRLYLGCSLDTDVVFAPHARTDDPARIVDRVAPHRFRVLIPARLEADQAAMVGRIVEAARPAHAAFEVRWFSGLLVVGESRVGVDSLVGESLRFEPIVLDRTDRADLAAGVLAADHPFDVADRIVSDRDRLGGLPAL
jgi:phage tail-like protein